MHNMNAQGENEKDKKTLGRFNPEHKAGQTRPGINTEGKQLRGDVVMYCTSWCPDCRRARAWLKEHRIEFVEVDIDEDPPAAAQVKEWAGGNRTVPTFDIYGTIVVSFNESRLLEALKKHGVA